jgi:hypothetical protein
MCLLSSFYKEQLDFALNVVAQWLERQNSAQTVENPYKPDFH